MEDLLSYSISDFLMYSPEIYYRLLGSYNEAIWPVHYVAFAFSLVIIWLIYWPRLWSGALVSAGMASAWGWTAAVYFQSYYVTISWAALYFMGLFALEAALLLIAGFSGHLTFKARPRGVKLIGLVLFALALVLMPWLTIFEGRLLGQDEMVWLTPDATVVATLALFLAASKSHWVLYVVPVIWAIVHSALLWAMENPSWWLMPLVILLCFSLRLRPKQKVVN